MQRPIKKMAVWALVFAGIAGCGSGPVAPHLNYVRGSIAFADKNAKLDSGDNAVVQFHPKSGDEGEGKITGKIADGAYSMTTEVDGEKIVGAPEGEFVVTITPAPALSEWIPKKYSDPKTSDFTATVKAGSNEIQPFEIVGRGEPGPQPIKVKKANRER